MLKFKGHDKKAAEYEARKMQIAAVKAAKSAEFLALYLGTLVKSHQ